MCKAPVISARVWRFSWRLCAEWHQILIAQAITMEMALAKLHLIEGERGLISARLEWRKQEAAAITQAGIGAAWATWHVALGLREVKNAEEILSAIHRPTGLGRRSGRKDSNTLPGSRLELPSVRQDIKGWVLKPPAPAYIPRKGAGSAQEEPRARVDSAVERAADSKKVDTGSAHVPFSITTAQALLLPGPSHMTDAVVSNKEKSSCTLEVNRQVCCWWRLPKVEAVL